MPTFTPDADPETNTVDGQVFRDVDASFGTIQAGAGTGFSDDIGGLEVGLSASSTSNQYNFLARSVILFNTASLDDGMVIGSATLTLTEVGNGGASTGLGDTTVEVCSSNPASNTALIADDYTTLGTTSFGSVTLSTIASDEEIVISLNASGIAAINKTGITKLGLRLGWDLNNSFTGAWSSLEYTGVIFHEAEDGVGIAVLTVTEAVSGKVYRLGLLGVC